MLKLMKKNEERPHFILGQNIARMRKARGFTNQGEFAHKVGIGISGLKDIERGIAEGRPDTRVAIADALGCSVSDLYKDPKEIPIPQTSTVAAFLDKFDQLSPLRQRIVLALVYNQESYLGSNIHQGLLLAVRALLKDT